MTITSNKTDVLVSDVLVNSSSTSVSSMDSASSSATAPVSRWTKHEVPRKAFHLFTGFFSIWLYVNGYNQRLFMKPFICGCLFFVVMDNVRFRSPRFNRLVCSSLSFMMRPEEHTRYNGILFFLAGLVLNTWLLPKDLCLLVNLLLSWGDTAASVVGREFGRYTPKIGAGKSVAGLVGSFAVGVGSCYLVYGLLVPKYHDLVDMPGDIMWGAATSRLALWQYALATGVIASVSELVDLGVDDNFTIPAISGACLYPLVAMARL